MSTNRHFRKTWNQLLGFTVSDETGFALSIFYGIFIVNLAIVCILFQFLSGVRPLDIAEYYLNILFLLSILWMIAFFASVKWGKIRNDVKEPVKSLHASNRWLKAVVAIFGFSIIIKNALELFAITKISPLCEHKILHILKPILHSPFVFGQVAFLFLFAKHYLQEWRHFSRFGIMHIMATNFSVWLQTVAGEATEALRYEEMGNKHLKATENGSETNLDMSYIVAYIFRGNCTCRNVYCERVEQADKFLFPFLIEFCLISTCLLYVTWKKVGKKPKKIHTIFKPSYKFFQAYKGPTLGALMFASTVTVIVLLGSSEPANLPSYLKQYEMLHLYEGFLTCCKFINLLACCAGFSLYARTNKKKLEAPNVGLDVVLLFVCFVGPLISGLFSILSLSIESDQSKAPGWGISLAYPVIDIIGTTLQILFIVYGMQHAPIPATSNLSSRLSTNNSHGNIQNKNDFLEETKKDLTQDEMELKDMKLKQDCLDDVKALPEQDVENVLLNKSISAVSSKSTFESVECPINDTQGNFNGKVRIAVPDKFRTALREILMFLVISNASVWIFLSLDKTVFTTLAYQHAYFGHSVWTTVTSITTPLSIFLHMHSAACFFELWSYA